MDYVYENHKLENKLLPFIFHITKLNGNSGANVSYGNWHENPEILFFTKGNGKVFMDREVYSVNNGDLVIVNTDTFHFVNTETDLEYYCLIIDTSFFIDNGIDINKIIFKPIANEEFKLEKTFMKLKSLYTKRGLYHEAKIRAEVCNIIVYICEKLGSVNNSYITYSNEIKQAIIYIKENFSNKITVDEIIKHVGMSRAYFSREFKKYTGLSIITYLNNIRCVYARTMLRSGISVWETAQTCGFDNQSYFTRTYKKIMGVLPSNEYQKRLAAE